MKASWRPHPWNLVADLGLTLFAALNSQNVHGGRLRPGGPGIRHHCIHHTHQGLRRMLTIFDSCSLEDGACHHCSSGMLPSALCSCWGESIRHAVQPTLSWRWSQQHLQNVLCASVACFFTADVRIYLTGISRLGSPTCALFIHVFDPLLKTSP